MLVSRLVSSLGSAADCPPPSVSMVDLQPPPARCCAGLSLRSLTSVLLEWIWDFREETEPS